jgi:hypothetical protein
VGAAVKSQPRAGFERDLREYFRTVSVRGISACPIFHATAIASGSHFGASLTASGFLRERHLAFGAALTRGWRGFVAAMESISTSHSVNRSISTRPSVAWRPGSRSSPALPSAALSARRFEPHWRLISRLCGATVVTTLRAQPKGASKA